MTNEEIKNLVVKAVCDARNQNPFAPSITNTVTINFVANAQLAVGGSAAMVYLPDEGIQMARMSKSMYINMGTQFTVYPETLPATAKAAFDSNNNWVLDPVGIGIGTQRSNLLMQFKEFKPKIIRGNASEIIALAKLWNLEAGDNDANVRGVDSTVEVDAAKTAAASLAKFTEGAVAVSGKTDLVTDGTNFVYCNGGSKYMPMVTGMGCSLGGVCSVYACVASPFIAAVTATCVYDWAGKEAEKTCKGSGSFYVDFVDNLSNAKGQDIVTCIQ